MNRLRLILIATALVMALLAAYLSAGLLKRPPAPAPSQPVVIQKSNSVNVLVAAKDLVQGEQLGELAVEWRAWPRDLASPDMITQEAMADALDKMKEARARLPMVAGEPIVAAKIVRPGERGFMSAILLPGMRAIALPISETSAVSGFVLPNDRVDVIFTHQLQGRSGDTAISETVLTNVKVLAINQALRAGEDGATIPGGRTAVLELDPQQSEVISKLGSDGSLSLVLRSLAEGGAAGITNDRPELTDAFRNPQRAASGPLVIRYGLERSLPNR